MSITAFFAALFLTFGCKFVNFDNNFDHIFDSYDEEGLAKINKLSGSGPVLTREFNVGSFSKLETNIPGNVEFKYTDGEPSVTITTYENIFDEIKLDTRDSTLIVRIKKAKRYNIKQLDILIKSPELSSITLNGAGDFETEETLCGENLDISISGAADVDIFGIGAGKSNISIAGAGDIDIENCLTGELRIAIAGAGDVNIDNIDCSYATLSLAGAGDIDLNGVADRVDLAIAGVGDIDISDLEIKELNQEIKGVGSVIR